MESSIAQLTRPKQEELLASAVRLFRQKGYHATSMQELAEAVGMQRGSLYHYIDAKEDVLWQIMRRTMDSLRAAVQPVIATSEFPADRLRQAIREHLRVAARLSDEMTILHVELKSLGAERRAAMIEERDAYQRLFRSVIDDGIARGDFRVADPAAAVFAILGACNWFTQWFRTAGPTREGAFADAFADLFLRGLTREPGRGA